MKSDSACRVWSRPLIDPTKVLRKRLLCARHCTKSSHTKLLYVIWRSTGPALSPIYWTSAVAETMINFLSPWGILHLHRSIIACLHKGSRRGFLFSPLNECPAMSLLTNIQGHSQEPPLRPAAILLGTPAELLITSKEAPNPTHTQDQARTVFLKV